MLMYNLGYASGINKNYRFYGQMNVYIIRGAWSCNH